VIALANAPNWTGVVDTLDQTQVRVTAGRVDATFGTSAMGWSRGHLWLRLRHERVEADLALRPLLLPTVTSSVSFGRDHAMHWVVIPRLEASGTATLDGRTTTFERALAYHDHNWGHFHWGSDLTWEWGYVNPEDASCPYSLVFVRVSDGGSHQTLSQGLLVWRGDVAIRTFQNRELDLALIGHRSATRPFTLPPIGALLLPGTSAGVPARLEIEARGGGDSLRMTFAPQAHARIAIPSDTHDFKLVQLNETMGPVAVEGQVGGNALRFQGKGVVEFVRG
jgi:hypothetical protein